MITEFTFSNIADARQWLNDNGYECYGKGRMSGREMWINNNLSIHLRRAPYKQGVIARMIVH